MRLEKPQTFTGNLPCKMLWAFLRAAQNAKTASREAGRFAEQIHCNLERSKKVYKMGAGLLGRT